MEGNQRGSPSLQEPALSWRGGPQITRTTPSEASLPSSPWYRPTGGVLPAPSSPLAIAPLHDSAPDYRNMTRGGGSEYSPCRAPLQRTLRTQVRSNGVPSSIAPGAAILKSTQHPATPPTPAQNAPQTQNHRLPEIWGPSWSLWDRGGGCARQSYARCLSGPSQGHWPHHAP